MDRDELKNQIDYVQARIEEIDKKIINSEPDQKGYKELVDSYNKWIDRYDEMIDRFEHFDDVDIERKKLELEEEKITSLQQIEQDKVNLEQERLRLEREKFAYETTEAKNKELIDTILRSADLGVKILVPLIGLKGTLTIARLAYTSDLDLKLCNGRIWGLLKLGSMKV